MKTDAQLKKDITDELEWKPSVNATHVGVAVGRTHRAPDPGRGGCEQPHQGRPGTPS